MVVFTRPAGTSGTDVWRENVNGTGRRRLTTNHVSSNAAWGTRGIAFARTGESFVARGGP